MCPHTITSFTQGQNEIAKPFSCTFFLFFSLHFLPLFPSVGQIDTFFAKKVGSSHCQSVTSVYSLSLHKWTISHILHMQRILQESLFYVIIVISQLLAHPLLATPPLASVRVFLQMFCFHFPLFLLIVEFLRSFSLFLFFIFHSAVQKPPPFLYSLLGTVDCKWVQWFIEMSEDKHIHAKTNSVQFLIKKSLKSQYLA